MIYMDNISNIMPVCKVEYTGNSSFSLLKAGLVCKLIYIKHISGFNYSCTLY